MPQKRISFLKAGLPMVTLTLGGWLGLSYFVKGRIDVQDAKQEELNLRAPVEKQRAKKFNVEEELQRLREATVNRDYENKPIPRPKEWDT